MNSNSTKDPAPDPEARLTALLLGELTGADADELRAELSQSPDLRRLYCQLESTAALVREAVRPPEPDANPEALAPQLTTDRRETLLASFNSAPRPSPQSSRAPQLSWWIGIAAAAALVGLIAIVGLTLFPRPEHRADQGFVTSNFAFAPALGTNPVPLLALGEQVQLLRQSTDKPELQIGERTVTIGRGLVETDTLDRKRVLERPDPALARRYGLVPTAPKPDLTPAKDQPELEALVAQRRTFGGGVSGGSAGGVATPNIGFKSKASGDSVRSFAVAQPESRGEIALGLPLLPAPPALEKKNGTLSSLAASQDLLQEKEEAEGKGHAVSSREPRGIALATPAIEPPPLADADSETSGRRPLRADDNRLRVQAQLLDDSPLPAEPAAALAPLPETFTEHNRVSTFSMNVTDVSFQLAAASLERGVLPEPGQIRSEEFINAFDYRDPEPAPGVALGFHWERARYPFAHQRDLLRFSVRTAAVGRDPARALNLVLVLDRSGSMERSDRVRIVRQALEALAGRLQTNDRISVVAFANTARLWIDGWSGDRAPELIERVGHLNPEGGTNLEDALKLGYETALRHFISTGNNRVILLTDGAANLGEVRPASLLNPIEAHRQRGIALDCFGIGWEGYNDSLLQELSRRGDGRYGFLNTPEDATTLFVTQLAGALRPAAMDLKVQVEFNPQRVTSWRQIGYTQHQLTARQFRDNTVDAAELGGAESGHALYVVQVTPQGVGPLGTVRVRYRVPFTNDVREQAWPLEDRRPVPALDQASPALRLSAAAGGFAEWLASSPFASDITPDRLLELLRRVPESFAPDSRPKTLEWMIRHSQAIRGR